MIYIIKDLDSQQQEIIKVCYSSKSWPEFKKTFDYYNQSYQLLIQLEGNRDTKKKLISRLSQYSIKDDWFYYNPTVMSIIKTKPISITRADLIMVLNKKGQMNKKLKLVCDYISSNSIKSIASLDSFKPFKKIIETFGLEKISSMRYRYKDILNILPNI